MIAVESIGNKIRELRNETHMTQKDLAEQLFVSAQAVSRWEKGEVEPSIETIKQIASIFSVSVDELLGVEETEGADTDKEEKEPEIHYVEKVSKPVLCICEKCNDPIYEQSDIERTTTYHRSGISTNEISHVYCKRCASKIKLNQLEYELSEKRTERKRAWGWGSVISIAVLIIGVIVISCNPSMLGENPSAGTYVGAYLGAVGIAALTFFFAACCFLDNTFVGEMWEDVASWGFKTMPGIIFSLYFEGIVFLICAKIFLAILSFLLACCSVALATALGLVCGLFAFPFAVSKSKRDIDKLSGDVDRTKKDYNALNEAKNKAEV